MSSASVDNWVPGVLSDGQVRTLVEEGWIEHLNPKSIDGSAFDLTVSEEGYEMVGGSVKPFGVNYRRDVLRDDKLARRVEPVNGVFPLASPKTFVFRVEQKLGSALLQSKVIYGQATARSSVGRVDVLARLIVDGMDTYEAFDPEGVSRQKGRMFIEVTPLTFNVLVKPGESLSQLRLFKGRPEDCEIRGEVLYRSVLKGATPSGVCQKNEHGTLSVDLSNARVGKSDVGCAFRQGV